MSDKSYVGMMLCFYCQEPMGLVLDRKLRDIIPEKGTYNTEPCDQCKSWMEQGVILISVKDGEDGPNPYRTGGWCVVGEVAFDEVPESRMLFIHDSVWDQMGLPRA